MVRDTRCTRERPGGLAVRAATFGIAAALLVPLAACAPESGANDGAKTASDASASSGESAEESSEPDASTDTESKGGSGGSWPEQATEEETRKNVELPSSFPGSVFPVPRGARIDDTGERSDGNWYLVLRAEDQTAADGLWESVISAGGFAVDAPSETADGGVAASLTNASLAVQGLTLPQEDGTVLLSYDIEQLD